MQDDLVKTKRDLVFDIDDDNAETIFKGLANIIRLRILRLITNHAFTVAQISDLLEIPTSTVNQHLKVLEESGLIITELRPASRGTEKVCAGVYDNISFDLLPKTQPYDSAIEISMPVGAYVNFEVQRPCGLASRNNIIGIQGDPESFLEPDHIDAQLLWFARGFVEYRFPKRLPPRTFAEGIYLSMEICSEAPGYNMDFPSDITLWINDVEVGTWTSSGDFGDVRGLLNPDWWGSMATQYGNLKTWQVNGDGSYIDGVRISDVTMTDLQFDDTPHISVKIGVKDDAEYVGGVNLFGRYFGNYPQDLVMRITYGKEI